MDTDPKSSTESVDLPAPVAWRRRLRDWWDSLAPQDRSRLCGLAVFTAALILLFANTLWGLLQLALKKEIHSHVLLIPVIAGYLLRIRKDTLPSTFASSHAMGTALFALASAPWAASLVWRVEGPDQISFMTLSFVLFFLGGVFLLLGRAWMKAAAFPMLFLFFMVPLPTGVVSALEHASKLASAEAADLFFTLTGTSYLRNGNIFHLPGVTMEVAQQCSGIRSSLVLCITGAFASNLLLQTTWRRWVLVLVVIPLGILRNGFRILTLGLLSMYLGPYILDSPIHHHGGPAFFLLSMIPLVAIVWLLRRGELKKIRQAGEPKGLEVGTR
jgi:exosortase C (VPDSG-CTERM-specific)